MWLAALFWGLNWPAVKIVLNGVSPWTLRAVGLAGGAILLAVAAVLARQTLAIPRAYWRSVIIAGLLNIAGFTIFAVFAQVILPASRAAILTFTMPLWAALFAWYALGERIDALRATALLAGAVGLGVLSVPFWPTLRDGGIPMGLVYVLGAAITWAAGTVYLKGHPIPAAPLALATWQVVVGAVVATAGMLAFEQPRFDLSGPGVPVALAYHIALPQAAAYVLWFSLMGRVQASTAALGTLLIPIFGVVGAILLLGERPTALDLIGFAILLAAVGLDQTVRSFKPAAPRP